MLCSLSLSSLPFSPSVSAPHWLDRLHPSIPLPPTASSSDPPCPPPPPLPAPATVPAALSAALSELFHFGERPSRPRRALRKQPNPRSCAPPGSEAGSCSKKRRRRARIGAGSRSSWLKKPADADEWEEGSELFSRTDVVVIDTSGGDAAWKSAKLVLRKGGSWKVRDKKLWTLAKKRRRLILAERRVSAAHG